MNAAGYHGTASSAAAVQLSSFAPIVLLAPAAGALADRYDRRLMMIIGDAGSVLGLSIILLALSSPRPRLAQVCAGAVVSSCLAALTEPVGERLDQLTVIELDRDLAAGPFSPPVRQSSWSSHPADRWSTLVRGTDASAGEPPDRGPVR